MGRTVPTFNSWLQGEIEDWRTFRRALRAEQREAFDHLFTRARKHTAAATCAARSVPFDAFLVSILLDQELELRRLAEEVRALRGGNPPPDDPPPPPQAPPSDVSPAPA